MQASAMSFHSRDDLTQISFQYHILRIVKRSYRMLGFITSSLSKSKNIDTYFGLYYCYIRSILECASPVWNSHHNVYINEIEECK